MEIGGLAVGKIGVNKNQNQKGLFLISGASLFDFDFYCFPASRTASFPCKAPIVSIISTSSRR